MTNNDLMASMIEEIEILVADIFCLARCGSGNPDTLDFGLALQFAEYKRTFEDSLDRLVLIIYRNCIHIGARYSGVGSGLIHYFPEFSVGFAVPEEYQGTKWDEPRTGERVEGKMIELLEELAKIRKANSVLFAENAESEYDEDAA